MDVESVSDELYGLPLDEFTPTRTAREKQARAAGKKDVAAQIHQLRKPNMVAWLANQLVRTCADEVRPLLELGARLREATANRSGQQLRELSRQQSRLIYRLVEQARLLATTDGRTVSSDTARSLETTLRAALADPDAADALAAGQLTEGMRSSGFGGSSGRVEGPAPSARKAAAVAAPSRETRQGTPEERKRAEKDLDQARSTADDAIRARQETRDLLNEADQMVTHAGRQVERVRRELDDARRGQSRAVQDQQRARAAFDRADRAAQDAQRHLADTT